MFGYVCLGLKSSRNSFLPVGDLLLSLTGGSMGFCIDEYREDRIIKAQFEFVIWGLCF